VPLAASWHTNLHEYAGRRAAGLMRWLPRDTSKNAESNIERTTLWATTRFYRLAKVHFAPNQELCDLLQRTTSRPCALMPRGVDTELFSPARRTRHDAPHDESSDFILGFVGRLSVEKNVALLAQVADELRAAGITRAKFLIIGQGEEEVWLSKRIPEAIFAGVLRGGELSRAYANMDLFVFPSHTDTFGNVVLEALASGVPAVVTPEGGPKYIVRDGETGFVAEDAAFASAVMRAINDRELHARMKIAARQDALCSSWDQVFKDVYITYDKARAVSHLTKITSPSHQL
jgi:glycosyltransferase involved in cell wall biosynthesis